MGSMGITTSDLQGETDRFPCKMQPYFSRCLGQQEGSEKVSQDERFQVFVQGTGCGTATRVLWVSAHTTVADACSLLGLMDVIPGSIYGSIGSTLLGWNDRLAQGGACMGCRVVMYQRMRGGSRPPLFDEWTCARCQLGGCWTTKRSCFRCGLPRAESEKILRSNPPGRIREVPPREEYLMGRPSPLKQNFVPPTKRKKGPRPAPTPAGGAETSAMHIDQVMELLRAIGIDAELMEHIQQRINVKTKAPQKPHSEVVE